MAYDKKEHCHTHQVKSRFNEEDFHELKDVSCETKWQHSVLVRQLTIAALKYRREHGELPFGLEKQSA